MSWNSSLTLSRLQSQINYIQYEIDQIIAGGGGVSNPMTEDLDGGGKNIGNVNTLRALNVEVDSSIVVYEGSKLKLLCDDQSFYNMYQSNNKMIMENLPVGQVSPGYQFLEVDRNEGIVMSANVSINMITPNFQINGKSAFGSIVAKSLVSLANLTTNIPANSIGEIFHWRLSDILTGSQYVSLVINNLQITYNFPDNNTAVNSILNFYIDSDGTSPYNPLKSTIYSISIPAVKIKGNSYTLGLLNQSIPLLAVSNAGNENFNDLYFKCNYQSTQAGASSIEITNVVCSVIFENISDANTPVNISPIV